MNNQIAAKKYFQRYKIFLVTFLALLIKKFTKLNHVNEARIKLKNKPKAKGLQKLFIEAAAA
jgi:hypothetical protein